MIFLLVYDRSSGTLLEEKRYDDNDIEAANEARLEAEICHADDPQNVEVVILQAGSRGDLEKTHARYFKSVVELSPRR